MSRKEIMWHAAMMLGALKLTKKEYEKVYTLLNEWLAHSNSIIVKVACMQTLADYSLIFRSTLKSVADEIKKQMISGSPAVKARGRHLLKKLGSVH
jgi:hypothetical protein